MRFLRENPNNLSAQKRLSRLGAAIYIRRRRRSFVSAVSFVPAEFFCDGEARRYVFQRKLALKQ